MATWHHARWPSATGGLAGVSPGFLRRASGVTFRGLGWFLRSRPLVVPRGCGRSAGRVRQVGFRLRA
jgi:hypothetical protein